MSTTARRSEPVRVLRGAGTSVDGIHVASTKDSSGGAEPTHRSIDSQSLFGDVDELHITHGDSRYRLKRTALGKLILTK